MDAKLLKRIAKVTSEQVSIVPYDSNWPKLFEKEKQHLLDILPNSIIKRIEHFGSTAIPKMSAKPIIDMLVEVSSLEKTKIIIVPILEKLGYEYFWRPITGNEPPFYAWFIKRNNQGQRSCHIHMVEADSVLWDRLYFKQYLTEYPVTAKNYEALKIQLAKKHPKDRVAYTKAKTEFIKSVTRKAKKHYLVV